jgi:hypothetical protein
MFAGMGRRLCVEKLEFLKKVSGTEWRYDNLGIEIVEVVVSTESQISRYFKILLSESSAKIQKIRANAAPTRKSQPAFLLYYFSEPILSWSKQGGWYFIVPIINPVLNIL